MQLWLPLWANSGIKTDMSELMRYYSNGKLLLTGEYLVLDGARALAVPTRFGQDLQLEETSTGHIKWVSYDNDGSIWFESIIHFDELNTIPPSDAKASLRTTLITILQHALVLNPKLLKGCSGLNISTRLTFPRKWGLGTSSTLINNIAHWAEVDAYELLHRSFGGSGYDIACAQHDSALWYQLGEQRLIQPIDYRPAFSNHLYFVYLNKKQNSRSAISSYYERNAELRRSVPAISEISSELPFARSLGEFQTMIQNHEAIISEIIEMNTVGDELFADFPGTTKSLGAWGGDFILAAHHEDPREYFQSKGYDTIFSWDEMVLGADS